MVNRSLLTVAAVGLVLVTSIVGAAYVTDIGESLLGGDSQTPPAESTPTSEPTATQTSTADEGDAAAVSGNESGGDGTRAGRGTSQSGLDVGGDATPTPTAEPTPTQTPTVEPTQTPTRPAHDFAFQTVGMKSCGSTCRDVTVRLTNRGTETATGVTVKSRIIAGGDQIWSGTEKIGRVQPGESVTRTKRVNLGFLDAAAVQQNNGYVTIKTTVKWDSGTQTFTERTKVT